MATLCSLLSPCSSRSDTGNTALPALFRSTADLQLNVFSPILNLLGQHIPEVHWLLRETAIYFTYLTLISCQFQRVPPPRSSAEFGEKHFQVHLIHDFTNFDYVFLSSQTSPRALLSASFLRTLWILWLPLHMDLMISKSHQQCPSLNSSVPVWHCVGRIETIPFPYALSTLMRILKISLLSHSHKRCRCVWVQSCLAKHTEF